MSSAKERITQMPFPLPSNIFASAEALIEALKRSNTQLKQRNEELDAEVSLVEQERDLAFYLLAKLYLAWVSSNKRQRDHWLEEVNSFLFNRGLQPCSPEHREALAALFHQVEEQEAGQC